MRYHLLLLTLLLVACGGDDFQTSYWVDAGGGAGGSEAGTDSMSDTSADEGLDVAAGGSAGSEAGSDVQADVELDAGVDASADAPAEAQPEACVPSTCASLGLNCGPVSDGCGATLSCGSCPTNQTCGGGGTPGVCGGCVPITCASSGQHCGLLEDGCGNTVDCGPYERGYDPSCQSGAYSHKWYCSPETDWAPPPFPTGCVPAGWPGSYCCVQDG